MTELALLKAARERISDVHRWDNDPHRSGRSACDIRGLACAPEDVAAVRWCAIGALDCEAALAGEGWQFACAARRLLDEEAVRLYYQHQPLNSASEISRVNDEIGHAAVLRVFDAVIARLEGR